MYIDWGTVRLDPFGHLAKKKAVAGYDKALAEYQESGSTVQSLAEELYELRSVDCKVAIEACEACFSALANTPKQFKKSVEKLVLEYRRFDDAQQQLHEAAGKVDWGGIGVTGGGALAGVGVATVAPTAAMAVATSFGTASTGAAISSLSGAAATNAALAWLGGGAVAAGGGGMAAGNALLALAGPVGWAIGGAAFLGGAVTMSARNGKVVEKAAKERLKIEEHHRILNRVEKEVGNVTRLTRQHVAGVAGQLEWLRKNAPQDYLAFGPDERDHLSALINNVRALSELIARRIDAK